jgi:hypothetical protein
MRCDGPKLIHTSTHKKDINFSLTIQSQGREDPTNNPAAIPQADLQLVSHSYEPASPPIPKLIHRRIQSPCLAILSQSVV